MKKVSLSLIAASFLLSQSLWAEIFVYGPGGPAPVIKKLAETFTYKTGEKVTVIAGPTPGWIEQAKNNADIIYSGNSSMMDAFIKNLPDQLTHQDIRVLGIREAGIVVRPNNPKNIQNFNDLLKPDVNIMVVDGAGQIGLYEDMALKNGERSSLVKLRKNIKAYAQNSRAAIDQWNSDKSIDALIIWSHWANSLGNNAAKFISPNKDHVIYRAAEIAITKTSKNRQQAGEFIEFLLSKEATKVWKEMGWEDL